jgi:hypothetical protein
MPNSSPRPAFEDKVLRERWLRGAALRLRLAKAPQVARSGWEGGPMRVNVGFSKPGGQDQGGVPARATRRRRGGGTDEAAQSRRRR